VSGAPAGGAAPAVERILVVRYSALGDVVLATSLLQPLRALFPGARIEWVTSPAYAPLLEGLPELAAVHRLGKAGHDAPGALRARLRGRFDLAIDLQEKVKSAWLTLAAAPRRLAFHRRTAGEALLALLGRDRPNVRGHATRQYADVLAPLGGGPPGPLRVALSDEARAQAAAVLAGAGDRPLVALAPGATWATKRWAPARFAEVGEALHADGFGLVLCAGPGDAEAVAAFRAACRAPIAADLTPLKVPGMAAALARVRLLVACDSGPVHLAAAVGTPALALFGPTSTVRWGPTPPGRALALGLPCQPCSNHGGDRCPLGHHRCLADLPPAMVVAAARELLA
jgi:lipopolysaccharide heptosyltransferase II